MSKRKVPAHAAVAAAAIPNASRRKMLKANAAGKKGKKAKGAY